MVFSSFLDGDHETGNTSTDPERASPNGLLAHGLPLQAFKSHPLRDTLYFEPEYILHLVMSDEEETNSVEVSPNITVELN
jgi:hypothetical protein